LVRISAEILSGYRIGVAPKGEDYYAFEIVGQDGTASGLPPVWVDPHASDAEIRAKLTREFRLAFDPDSEPGDLSVPGL
jgi:hypothetical protein